MGRVKTRETKDREVVESEEAQQTVLGCEGVENEETLLGSEETQTMEKKQKQVGSGNSKELEPHDLWNSKNNPFFVFFFFEKKKNS